jgi:hypothetical protein
MGVGVGIFLLAVGGVLAFAVLLTQQRTHTSPTTVEVRRDSRD